MLYEAATGLPPEEFPNPPPEWLSGEIPFGALELHEVALRACDPDPVRRYPSAVALQADLALLQSGQSVRAARRLERRVHTLRRVDLATAAVALLASALVLVAAVRARTERANAENADRLRRRAETAEQNARHRLAEAQLAKAGLLRRSGAVGQRFETLELLHEAVPIASNLVELRTEAVAARALADLRERRSRNYRGPAGYWCTVDKDFRVVTAAHPDGSVWIHDWETDQPRTALEDARAEGLVVWPFDAAGTVVAGLRGDEAFVWETAHGRRTHRVGRAGASAVDLAPDGRTLFLRTRAGTVHRVPLDGRPEPPPIEPGFADGVFWPSPDGRWIAFTSPSQCLVELHPLAEGTRQRFQLPPPACPQGLLWTADSKGLVVAADDFRGYHFRPDLRTVRFSGHQAEIVAGVPHPTAPYALSSSWDGSTRLWNLETGRQLLRLPGYGMELQWTRLGRVGLLRHLGEGEFQVVEYEAATPSGVRVLTEPMPPRALSGNKGAWDVAFLAGGRAVAVGTYDGVRIWPTDGGEPGLVPIGWSRWLESDPSGTTLWVSTAERVLRFTVGWDPATGRLRIGTPVPTDAEGHEIPLARVATDGSLLVVRDRELLHLHPGPTTSLGRLPDTTSRFQASADGRWLLCGDYQSKDMQLLERPSLQVVRTLEVGMNPHGIFLGDGEDLVVTHASGLRRERTRDGAVRWEIPKPGGGTGSGPMAVDPTGRLLAVALGRREISLLRADTGERLCDLDAPEQGVVVSLRFHPDGTRLAAATGDHASILWDLADVRASLRALSLDWPERPDRLPVVPASPVAAPDSSGPPTPAVAITVAVPSAESVRQGPVDFSAFFTHTLANFHSGGTGNRFEDLPTGPITLDGIPFELRGIVQLGGKVLPNVPGRVEGIPVHRRCRRLHFLHASAWDGPERGEIGHYLVHHGDGTKTRIPLVHGENIRDWWIDPSKPGRPAPAWTGNNPHLRPRGLKVGLFHFAWDNPHPDQTVAFVTFATDGRDRLPFLVALSTE